MPKNLLQDMVKIKHLKVEPKSGSRNFIKIPNELKGKGERRWGLWIVAIISVAFFLFALSYLFSKATITVNPKVANITLNENLSASKENDVLPFDLVVISGEENKIVTTTEQKDVLEKAKGQVLLYNNFSYSAQLLSIDTRLEGSNGKIYKTAKRVTVPGMSDGKPSFVEVGIYALEAGEPYNSAPLDFKILGFKGSQKYEKFYGRSKGEITGGLVGKFPFISDEQKILFKNELKTTLQEKLLKKATDQIPNGFILFKDAVFLDIDELNVDYASMNGNNISVQSKGTLYGLLFNEMKLTKKIASNVIEKYDGSEIYIQNIRDLSFLLVGEKSISLGDVKNINFNISGTTKIVFKLNLDKFMADLLAKPKKDFNQILLSYLNIESANLAVSPFWKRFIPDKVKNIKVIVNYPK